MATQRSGTLDRRKLHRSPSNFDYLRTIYSEVSISSQIEVFQLLSPPTNMVLGHITQCRSPRRGRGDLGKLFSYVHESIEDITEL